MKHSWMTWPIVGAVIFLLTVFLALQYRWQVKAGDAEREIMQNRVQADARRFAEDFNREIQGAYFNFQMDSDSWQRSDWTEFNDRYDFWRARSLYPEIVRDFYYWRSGSDEWLRYDRDNKAFVEAEIPRELAELKSVIANDETFKPFYEDQFALAMPIHSGAQRVTKINVVPGEKLEQRIMEMPLRDGYLIIQLDREVATQKILPELAAKYFPDGEFKIDVRDKNSSIIFQTAGDVSQTDAAEKLLTFSPENMIFFSNKAVLPRSPHKQAGVIIDQHIESHSFVREVSPGTKTKTFTFELNADGPHRQAAIVSGEPDEAAGWNLSVQHSSGSVGAFISGEQNRKLAAGFGIYLLVIGAIVAITFSAVRSQKFAQRQIDFVSSVSHEFRTPLAVIYSAGENLADGVANDRSQIERYGTLIKSEGKKLSAMVEQILEFAGARGGKRKFNFTRIDLNEVVEKSLDECDSLKTKGFVVEKELSTRLPAISGDSEALGSAVQNLFQNALKYANGNRWIRVSTSFENGNAAIRVEDRGIGIAQGDLSKIFDPFYRSKEVVDAQIHGNGLGLSLVKEIADAHNGRVSAESEVGRGSTFTIELPVAGPDA